MLEMRCYDRFKIDRSLTKKGQPVENKGPEDSFEGMCSCPLSIYIFELSYRPASQPPDL